MAFQRDLPPLVHERWMVKSNWDSNALVLSLDGNEIVTTQRLVVAIGIAVFTMRRMSSQRSKVRLDSIVSSITRWTG